MSKLDRWTRQLLERQARKRGVQNPESRTQPELLREIVAHDYEAPDGLRQSARKLVGAWLGSAVAALGRGHGHDDDHDRDPDAHRSLPREGTATLALPAGPAGAGGLVGFQAAPAVLPAAAAAPGRDHIDLVRKHAEVRLSWQVSESATQRARALLGQPGELAVRVVSVHAEPARLVESRVSEHGPVTPNGTWTVTLPSPLAHCVSAIGLRHGDRFVSIAHNTSRATQ